jgi:hypothetical protein
MIMKLKYMHLKNIYGKNGNKKKVVLKQQLDTIKSDIAHAQEFIKDYDNYINKQRFLEDEANAHKLYQEWEIKYNTLIEKRSKYDLEYRRKLLDEKFTKWQNENNMRVDLVDKIKQYEAYESEIKKLQRILNYIDFKKISDEKKLIDIKVKECSDDIVRHEKEMEDLDKISANIEIYDS